MRYRKFTAALLVFCLFFQLLPLPALAGGGRRGGHHRTDGHGQGQAEA